MRQLTAYKLSVVFLLLLNGVGGEIYGQFYSFDQLVDAADEAYEANHYHKALTYYMEAAEVNDKIKGELLFRIGDAAYQAHSLQNAETFLGRYLDTNDKENEPTALYTLARLNHMKGDYANARTYYELYNSEYPDVDPKLTEEVSSYLESLDWIDSNEVENQVDTVIRLDNNINSPESDMSPYYLEEELYYSSLRFPIEDDELMRYRSQILKENIALEFPGVKQSQLLSNPAFSPEGDKIFFSICEYANSYELRCVIFRADIDSLSKVSGLVKLPEVINAAGKTTSHPSIAKTDNGYRLYFSAGPLDKMDSRDIYYSDFTGNMDYSKPKKIKEINTSKDEITPYYHNPTKTLYFSSNGHPGYGGYDIYKLEEGSAEAINVGKKLNTSYNDIYYTLDNTGKVAHLSSNRPGSLYAEDKYETCCYDIYRAKEKVCELDLRTLAYDNETKLALDGITIKITDQETDEILFEKTLNSNSAKITLPCDKKLQLTASKDGYDDLTIDLSDLEGQYGEDNLFEKDLYLVPTKRQLTVTILDELNKSPLNGADIYLTDLSTNEQVVLINHAGHIGTFSLKPNTEYLIEVNKDGYKEASVRFNSGTEDVEINKELYLQLIDIVQKSMVGLENAIPVSLYFDNDMPDKGSNAVISTKSYSQTYLPYYGKKDKFKNIYFTQYKGSDKLIANQQIEHLFENEIRKGFDKYNKFKEQLEIVLQSGQDVNIYLRGYTSPIAQSEYNTNLGKRRVDSVRKEFYTWKGGALIPYLESGQLKITERSFGETTSPASVSDDPNAPSRSIFSPEASLERRVEIDEINFNEQ